MAVTWARPPTGKFPAVTFKSTKVAAAMPDTLGDDMSLVISIEGVKQ